MKNINWKHIAGFVAGTVLVIVAYNYATTQYNKTKTVVPATTAPAAHA